MSTLNVANVTDGTDTVATGYVVNGSVKSFVTYNFSNGISESFNTSSVTDVSDGVGRQAYTSAMNITAHTTLGNAQGGAHNTTFLFCEITNVTTSQREWNTGTSASNGVNALGDNTTCHVALGDLA